MGNSTKRILGIGILKEASGQDPNYDPDRVKQEVNRELARLEEAGFEMTLYFADSTQLEKTLPEVEQHLKNGPWDGISIGFGLRGAIEYTSLFEDIVNMVVTKTWGPEEQRPRFMFTASTTDIYDAAIRVLGV